MALVQTVVFGDKKDCPVPKVLLAVVLIQAILDRIAFTNVDRWQATPFRRAHQHIDARFVDFRPSDRLLVVGPIKDDANPDPIRFLDHAEAIRITIWDEYCDGERALLEIRHLINSKKRSAETRTAPRTPAKGPTERYLAGAPFRRERSSKHRFSSSRAFRLRLAVFEEAAT